MIHILNQENSVLNTFLREMRDCEIQKDSLRFRYNIRRIAHIAAYEISKTFQYKVHNITTPLGSCEVLLAEDNIVLGTVLRAGLPFHQGFLEVFDKAENSFVAAYRTLDKNGKLSVQLDYVATPCLQGKTLLLVDPMLATGKSLIDALDALISKGGKPQKIHIAALIAAKQGVDYVLEHTKQYDVELWCATVDKSLNETKYIVPGLGDAGDLSFGEKL